VILTRSKAPKAPPKPQYVRMSDSKSSEEENSHQSNEMEEETFVEEQPRFSQRLNNKKVKKVYVELEEERVFVERQVYHKIPVLKKG